MDAFHTFYLRISPAKISLLRFLLEGYEGLAIVSTLDVKQGLIRLLVHKTRTQEFWDFIEAVSLEYNFSAHASLS